MIVGLVACSKSKLAVAAPARELYTGQLFRLASAYVETECDAWYILSARHGLVAPDTVLAPYNVSLVGMPAADRRRWAGRVMEQLAETLDMDSPHQWLVLAGKTYREYLVDHLPGSVSVPMAGLGIGQQIQFLRRRQR